MSKTSTARRALPFRKIEPTARIVVPKGTENPFREGTATYKRGAAVLRANGKPVGVALKAGARVSTVRYLAREKVIRLVTK